MTIARIIYVPHLQAPALKILVLIKYIMKPILDGQVKMAGRALVHKDIRRCFCKKLFFRAEITLQNRNKKRPFQSQGCSSVVEYLLARMY